MKTLLGTPRLHGCKDSVSKQLNRKLNSVFDRYWLDQINTPKMGNDGVDHNKLRFYKTLKGSFTQEPYITNIQNKSQRVAYQIPGKCCAQLEVGIRALL